MAFALGGPLGVPEPIHVKEGRGLVATVRHICRNHGCSNSRVRILSDNMSLTLAVSKGRCADYRMRRLCQQLLALCRVCNLRLSLRWFPSEVNSADADSRNWESAVSKTHKYTPSSSGETIGTNTIGESERFEREGGRAHLRCCQRRPPVR